MFAKAAQQCLYLKIGRAGVCVRFLSQTYYEVLGVPRSASQKQIQQAFLEKSKQLHPDTKIHDGEQHDKFVRLNEAYTCLNRPESRHKYDLTLPDAQSSFSGPQPVNFSRGPRRGLSRVSKTIYYKLVISATIAGVLTGMLYLVTLDMYNDREQELFLLFKSPEAPDDKEEA